MIGALTTALLMLWPIVSRILEVEPIVDLLQWLIAVLPLIIVAVALVLLAAATGNLVAELVQPHTTERQIGWIGDFIRHLERHGLGPAEPTTDSEEAWGREVTGIANATLIEAL